MTNPSVADIAEAHIAIAALARHVSDTGIDVEEVRVLMEGIDSMLVIVVSARLLRNACTDLAHYIGTTTVELLDTITAVAADQAVDG